MVAGELVVGVELLGLEHRPAAVLAGRPVHEGLEEALAVLLVVPAEALLRGGPLALPSDHAVTFRWKRECRTPCFGYAASTEDIMPVDNQKGKHHSHSERC